MIILPEDSDGHAEASELRENILLVGDFPFYKEAKITAMQRP